MNVYADFVVGRTVKGVPAATAAEHGLALQHCETHLACLRSLHRRYTPDGHDALTGSSCTTVSTVRRWALLLRRPPKACRRHGGAQRRRCRRLRHCRDRCCMGGAVAQHMHPYCTPTAGLQRYETCARLACGRHTTVYLARDMQADGALVAVKVFQQAHYMPQVRQRKSERMRYALRCRLGSPPRGTRRGVGGTFHVPFGLSAQSRAASCSLYTRGVRQCAAVSRSVTSRSSA